MKKVCLLLIVCSCFLSLRAQEDYTDEAEYEETEVSASPIQARLDKAVAKFQLTDEQVPKMKELLLQYAQDLKENPPASQQEKGARRRALRASVSKILTPAQLQQMRQGKSRGGARKQSGNRNSPRQGKSDNWLDRLIDDIAVPLLEKRQRNRRGGGED